MRLRAGWQVVASWVFTFAFGISISTFALLTLGRFQLAVSPAALRFWGRTMLRIAGVRLEVSGAEHLAADTPKIAIFNHTSMLDAFLCTAIFPDRTVAAIKHQVLYYPVVGLTVYLMGFLIIDRGHSGRARRTMDRAARRMTRDRLTVFISPEGTRTKTGEVLPFKKGAFHLALATRADIVPIVFDGAFELHPPGRAMSAPGLVRCSVLPARSSAHLTAENLGAEAEALRSVLIQELARLRAQRPVAEDAALAPALAA